MVASFEFIEPTPPNEDQRNWLVTMEQKLLASVCEDSPHKHFLSLPTHEDRFHQRSSEASA